MSAARSRPNDNRATRATVSRERLFAGRGSSAERARAWQLCELVTRMHPLDTELLAQQQRALADLQHQLVATREVLDHVHELLEEGRGSVVTHHQLDPLRRSRLVSCTARALDLLVVGLEDRDLLRNELRLATF